MKEDLDNVPELDSFFVYPIHKVHYKVPVDLAIRDYWMPYLYTNAPFLLFFKNDYTRKFTRLFFRAKVFSPTYDVPLPPKAP